MVRFPGKLLSFKGKGTDAASMCPLPFTSPLFFPGRGAQQQALMSMTLKVSLEGRVEGSEDGRCADTEGCQVVTSPSTPDWQPADLFVSITYSQTQSLLGTLLNSIKRFLIWRLGLEKIPPHPYCPAKKGLAWIMPEVVPCMRAPRESGGHHMCSLRRHHFL